MISLLLLKQLSVKDFPKLEIEKWKPHPQLRVKNRATVAFYGNLNYPSIEEVMDSSKYMNAEITAFSSQNVGINLGYKKIFNIEKTNIHLGINPSEPFFIYGGFQIERKNKRVESYGANISTAFYQNPFGFEIGYSIDNEKNIFSYPLYGKIITIMKKLEFEMELLTNNPKKGKIDEYLIRTSMTVNVPFFNLDLSITAGSLVSINNKGQQTSYSIFPHIGIGLRLKKPNEVRIILPTDKNKSYINLSSTW